MTPLLQEIYYSVLSDHGRKDFWRGGTVGPIVAIVGQQNVGKSILLDRLAGKQVAIVEDLPGTTRGRVRFGKMDDITKLMELLAPQFLKE